jgi:hypothetical protein
VAAEELLREHAELRPSRLDERQRSSGAGALLDAQVVDRVREVEESPDVGEAPAHPRHVVEGAARAPGGDRVEREPRRDEDERGGGEDYEQAARAATMGSWLES